MRKLSREVTKFNDHIESLNTVLNEEHNVETRNDLKVVLKNVHHLVDILMCRHSSVTIPLYADKIKTSSRQIAMLDMPITDMIALDMRRLIKLG